MTKLTYLREQSKTICPICGGKAELVFRYHCTNAQCRNYEKSAVLPNQTPKVGDRIKFIANANKDADEPAFAEFKKTFPFGVYDITLNKYYSISRLLYYKAGGVLEGSDSPVILAYTKEYKAGLTYGLTNHFNNISGMITNESLWFPLAHCAKY